VVILMHHLDLHARSAQSREENTVYVQSTSTPKHAQMLPPTFKERSGQQPATGAIPTRTTPVSEVSRPASAVPVSNVPVDISNVSFDANRASQDRGGD
jgi:hypothetical protein